MLAAMDNPHLTIIGHPTGRLLLSRDPYGAGPRRGHREGRGHRASRWRSTRIPTGSTSTGGCSSGCATAGAMVSIGADAHNVAGIGQRGVRRRHGPEGVARPRRHSQRAGRWTTSRLRPRTPSVSRRRKARRAPSRRGDAGAGRNGPAPRGGAGPGLLRRLKRRYPDARCALDHRNAYELLCATILSAQCTDARVNMVTPTLFARYPDPGGPRAGAPRGRGGDHPLHRVLPQQDPEPDRHGAGRRGGPRGRGPAHHGGAAGAARSRPQDGERRPRERLRDQRGDHGGHPRDPAVGDASASPGKRIRSRSSRI